MSLHDEIRRAPRLMVGYSPAYTEADFLRRADELERLGESARMLGSS